MRKIKKIGGLQTAKMLSILYFFLSVCISVPIGLFVLLASGGMTKDGVPWWIFMILPIFYLLLTFVATIVLSFAYNLIAGKIGGVAIEISEEE